MRSIDNRFDNYDLNLHLNWGFDASNQFSCVGWPSIWSCSNLFEMLTMEISNKNVSHSHKHTENVWKNPKTNCAIG